MSSISIEEPHEVFELVVGRIADSSRLFSLNKLKQLVDRSADHWDVNGSVELGVSGLHIQLFNHIGEVHYLKLQPVILDIREEMD